MIDYHARMMRETAYETKLSFISIVLIFASFALFSILKASIAWIGRLPIVKSLQVIHPYTCTFIAFDVSLGYHRRTLHRIQQNMSDFEFNDDILRVITQMRAALPPDFKYEGTPLSISPCVNVKFPTYGSSLSRLHDADDGSILDEPAIVTRYWQACQRFQSAITHRYFEVIKNLESLEGLGGPSDLSLQGQVARGLSQLYEEWEKKLANCIIQRYRKPVSATRENVQLEKVSVATPSCVQTDALRQQKEAIHILRRAFAVNTSPTDAERDYLAKQTGMTYRQVTVWVRLLSFFHVQPLICTSYAVSE
jgi:hypothetical protein